MDWMDPELRKDLDEIKEKLNQLLYIKPLVEKHETIIHGNGDVGLVVRVDRIEQRAESHKWLLGISSVALLTALGDWVQRLWK